MAERSICLTVMGRERPGIIAAITGVLYELECNIRDSTMTVLANEFAMLLIVELPDTVSSADLDQALLDAQRRFDLSIFIKRLTEDEVRYQPPSGTKIWAVTIYGGDRKGIVHHVASVMARKGISITELKTKVIGGLEGAGIVSMKVLAPANVELASIREQLNDVATRFGVEVSVG